VFLYTAIILTVIPVTKPFLPPREEYQAYLEGIWERNWLTNHGPLSVEFEQAISNRFGCPHFNSVSNGTIALQIAFKVLQLSGEVITTPFSYVATTSALVWEGLTPVFADVDPQTLNISPSSVEEKITHNTSAILATHVYGNPCDIEALEAICEKHGLKLIFDAAHAFGSTYKGRSVFSFGDISTVSFHATKLFHTIEGGGVFTKGEDLSRKVYDAKNFGHNGESAFRGVGINGKMAEFNAAMGLINLNYVDGIIKKRIRDFSVYSSILSKSNGTIPELVKNGVSNRSYFAFTFESENQLLDLREGLDKLGIATRRYFYPTLNKLPYVAHMDCPRAEDIASRILCLPLYFELEEAMIVKISEFIVAELK